jgi:hypothetical protein
LDSTTIDLCLSLFPWARFRQHKAAVKMHTLLDLHGILNGRAGISASIVLASFSGASHLARLLAKDADTA